jgi:stearoyl-CoA desaturase (delta-9 desaturase)
MRAVCSLTFRGGFMTDDSEFTIAWSMVVLVTVLTMSTAIGVPLFACFYDYTPLDWILLAVLYVATGMGITIGYHRLLSHRSFECPSWVKACLLVVGGWALQNSALLWCADHIRHHARCDQEEDPYNATKGFWYSHFGWLFVNTPYREEKYAARLRKDPVVMWQHRYYVPIVVSGLTFPFVIGLINGGWTGGLGCFLLAGVLRTVLVLNSTFTINSLCHIWGSQPHGAQDSSRDSWVLSLISFGEGFHNYHHTFARDYRNGPKWYNFDPSKWIIYCLSLLGLASHLRRRDTSVC